VNRHARARSHILCLALLCAAFLARPSWAQDLTPRAYIVTPIHSNAIVLSYGFQGGDILINPTLPLSNSKGNVHIPVVSYSHSFSFFGRTAAISAILPYGVGHFTGEFNGISEKAYRSGLYDSEYRLSVNLKGGPAMTPREYMQWKQKTLIGISLTVTAPTGQYDPTKLVNLGTNRWAIKPELGISYRRKNWVYDFYVGCWFFTENPEYFSHNAYFPGVNVQTQNPLAAIEGHISYDVKPRLWISLDGNYWYGGSVYLNGDRRLGTLDANSRIGVTASTPIRKHQSLKFSYNYGAVTRVGGQFTSVSVGWQYSWVGRPN
jgi:hypothetical protein